MVSTLPTGFLVRPPTMDDLEAVTALTNTGEIADSGVPETTVDLVRTRWQAPGVDLVADNWLVVSPEGHVVGYAGMSNSEHARIYANIRVHPEYQGKGIAAVLLQQVEERASQHVSAAPRGARVTLNTWTSSRNLAIKQLLEQAGYTPVRYTWDMEIVMQEAPPVPQWPQGVIVRTFVPGLERAVFETDEEAFQDHWGHMPGKFEEWKYWMIKRENFDPTLWFLAFDGDMMAGISLCTYERDDGWVGTLAVRRPWRRKGLGIALLFHSFAEFYRRDTYKVGLSVDSQNLTGATRLYERAGMHVARQYDTYQKELRPGVELSTQTITV